jgi:hypothetical protein
MERPTTETVAAQVPKIGGKFASQQVIRHPMGADVPAVATILGTPQIPSGPTAMTRTKPGPATVTGPIDQKEESALKVLQLVS